MDHKSYWEQVYETRSATEVSWYQPHLRVSLDLIMGCGIARDAGIIDVGGGASTLVDDLLASGFGNVTVLDISGRAIGAAQARLGGRAGAVTWIEGDVTQVELPPRSFHLWHDRAVFHFLTDAGRQRSYAESMRRALVPGGHAVIGTFGPSGPSQCSGLEVMRYSPEGLAREFGVGFRLLEGRTEQHVTPSGGVQAFAYGHLLRA